MKSSNWVPQTNWVNIVEPNPYRGLKPTVMYWSNSSCLTHQFEVGDKFEETQGSTTFIYEVLRKDQDPGGPYYEFSIKNKNDHYKTYPNGEYYEYVLTQAIARGEIKNISSTPHKTSSTGIDLNSPNVWNEPWVDHTTHEVITNTALGKSFNYCRTCKKEVF